MNSMPEGFVAFQVTCVMYSSAGFCYWLCICGLVLWQIAHKWTYLRIFLAFYMVLAVTYGMLLVSVLHGDPLGHVVYLSVSVSAAIS